MTVRSCKSRNMVCTTPGKTFFQECEDRALYEAQSTQNHAIGCPPTLMCSRHAEIARRNWDLLFIRSLAPNRNDTVPPADTELDRVTTGTALDQERK